MQRKDRLIIENIYDFAFTAASIRLKELLLVAKEYHQGIDQDLLHAIAGGKEATLVRKKREHTKRLKRLTSDQLDVLIQGDLISQRQIAFLSVCKTYKFIRDFVIEILLEKYLVFDFQVTEGDFLSFYRRKESYHDEMLTLSESTQKKIKTVCFLMLEEAGIIDNTKRKHVQPQLLNQQVVEVIKRDNAEWLKIFLMSDLDLKKLT